jgi:DNA-directed RNA polymerase subunit B
VPTVKSKNTDSKSRNCCQTKLPPTLGEKRQNRKEKLSSYKRNGIPVIQLKTGRRQPDDKDHFKTNVRLGPPLADLFVSHSVTNSRHQISAERIGLRPNITALSRSSPRIITERFQHALATATGEEAESASPQLLDRTNYISTLSHLRRLQSPLSEANQTSRSRDLHPTHWGRLCPTKPWRLKLRCLSKNLALSASIAVGVNPDKIKQLLLKWVPSLHTKPQLNCAFQAPKFSLTAA